MTTDASVELGWYVTRENGKSSGPLNDEAMRQAIGRGLVKPEDHVWRDGMNGWVEAREIPNFFDVRKIYREEHRKSDYGSASKRTKKEKINEQPWSKNITRKNKPEKRSAQSMRPDNSAVNQERIQQQKATTQGNTTNRNDSVSKEEVFEQLSNKVGTIPPATIAFLVLGIFMVPLLPLFWFIAWRIWLRANK